MKLLKKNNKRYIYSLLITLLIMVTCTGCKGADNSINENGNKSFFLMDSNSKYALFNEDGKQLTKFIYDDTYGFVNGTAIVKKDKEVGIINSNGKMTVPFGKYKYIHHKGNLYTSVEDKDELYHQYLIDGKGKVVYSLDNYKELNYMSELYIVLEDQKRNNYVILNTDGKELVKLPKVSSSDKLIINDINGYVSISYNNKTMIYNLKTAQQLYSYDSPIKYCLDDISDDESVMTLISCSDSDNLPKKYYVTIKNGKLHTYDENSECDSVYQYGKKLICQKKYSHQYIIDSNFNVGMEITKSNYIDDNNYALTVGEQGKESVQIYQNGNLVKEIPCMSVYDNGPSDKNMYILKSVYSKECGKNITYGYYNTNGDMLINKMYESARYFDNNGLAQVSDDEKNYYLINKNGVQVSEIYSRISSEHDYYITKNNKLEGILNKEGKEIYSPNYSDVKIVNHGNKLYVLLKSTDSKYIVYDLINNKEIIKSDSILDINSPDYIIGVANNKKQYYTYNGTKFYER